MIVQKPADLSFENKISVACNLEHLIKYTKIFTPESSIYQRLYRKNCLIAVILSKKNLLEPNSFVHMFNASTL